MAFAEVMTGMGLTPPPEKLLLPALLVTILTVIVGAAYAISLLFSPSHATRDSVVIIGVSPSATVTTGPGKTTLLHVVRTGHTPPMGTVPSQIANEGCFPVSCQLRNNGSRHAMRDIRWVDFPGHARLRSKLSDFLSTARGIVFVVDSSPTTFSRTVREAADLLHDVLKHPCVSKYATPLLVLCSKADMPGAIAPADVKRRLEAELERMRRAKVAGLAGARNAVVLDTAGETSAFQSQDGLLGYENEDFRFEHLQNNIRFDSGSAKNAEISSVVTFVEEIF